MAREILVKLWCDPCLSEDQRVEGRELTPLSLPELTGRRARVITLCERHEKELYTPLVEILEEHGQPVDEEGNPTTKGRTIAPASGNAPHQRPTTCPDCGHAAPNRAALASHARGQHDKTLGQLLGLPTPYKCPECAAEGVDYESNRPQGLAAHRRQVHGVVGENTKAKAKAKAAADQPELPTGEPEKKPAKRATSRPRKKA